MDDNKNETKMRATAPSVGSFNADISESNPKCWVCKSSNHFVDQCRKFSAMNTSEGLQAVKDNHDHQIVPEDVSAKRNAQGSQQTV